MLKTYSPKLQDIKRQWFIIDVKDKTVGRIATKIADILRGKNKALYSPHLDCGDFVIVINAKEVKFTGTKFEKKTYHTHSRYGNGLKETTPKRLKENMPERILSNAIAGMIPHNKIKKDVLKKLKIYGGTEHKHTAQQPAPLEL